jgi:ribonuclease BN (tRNA processing enzyme)
MTTSSASVEARFIGCGDAVGSGGRFQACILISTPTRRLLLDCGATSISALKRGGIDPSSIGAILISHLHGDHFAGIPFLVLDGQFSHRREPLTIVGPAETEARVRAALVNMYPGFANEAPGFPLTFVEIGEDDERELAGIRLRAWSVPHDPLANPLALRVWLDGVTVAYSGDTAWTEKLVEVADRADLFICEAQTLAPKARIHISYAEVVQHRSELRAARIVLTHMGADVLSSADLDLERASDELVVHLSSPSRPAPSKARRS